MRRRIAIIALAVAALTVGPATAAQAKPVGRTVSMAPSFCLDVYGIGLCLPAPF